MFYSSELSVVRTGAAACEDLSPAAADTVGTPPQSLHSRPTVQSGVASVFITDGIESTRAEAEDKSFLSWRWILMANFLPRGITLHKLRFLTIQKRINFRLMFQIL